MISGFYEMFIFLLLLTKYKSTAEAHKTLKTCLTVLSLKLLKSRNYKSQFGNTIWYSPQREEH